MNTLNWSKLHQRWKFHLLLTTFKCLKGDASVYLSSQFSFATHSHHTRGQTYNTLEKYYWEKNILIQSRQAMEQSDDIRYNYKEINELTFFFKKL